MNAKTIMELALTGTVQKIFTTEVVGASGFQKRDIVLRTNEQYPQDICFQFVQDRCDMLDPYKPGEEVTIHFNLRGKIDGFTNANGETKYFNTLQGWKIQRTQNGQAATANTANTSAPAPAAAPASNLPKKYQHTDTEFTEAQYLASPGWTHEILVQRGKGKWIEATTQTQAPTAAPPANNEPLF